MKQVYLLGLMVVGLIFALTMVSASGFTYPIVAVHNTGGDSEYNAFLLASADRVCDDTDGGFDTSVDGTVTIYNPINPSLSRSFDDRDYFDGVDHWRIEYFCGYHGEIDGQMHEGKVYALLVVPPVAKN